MEYAILQWMSCLLDEIPLISEVISEVASRAWDPPQGRSLFGSLSFNAMQSPHPDQVIFTGGKEEGLSQVFWSLVVSKLFLKVFLILIFE